MQPGIDFYNKYFQEFNRLAIGEFADLSYGNTHPNDTASSYESIIAYANYIDTKHRMYNDGPRILNAGAGASSWMFRKMFGYRIICADSDEKYLKFIQYVCHENGLFSGQFKRNLFLDSPVDHVYFDYGSIERLPYLGAAIDNALVSVYVDDVDERLCSYPYRQMVIDLCKSLDLKWFDCKESLDSYGRSGIIIEKS